MLVAKALALTGIKVIMDDRLFKEVSAPHRPYPPGITLTYLSIADQEGFHQTTAGRSPSCRRVQLCESERVLTRTPAQLINCGEWIRGARREEIRRKRKNKRTTKRTTERIVGWSG